MRHAHPDRGRVHPCDEGVQAGTVGVREGISRVRPRRHQQRRQQLLRREYVSRVQRRAFTSVLPGVVERRFRHPDLPPEVAGFQHQQGGHHLGDTRHRPFGAEITAPQHLAAGRVGEHRALGLHPAGRAGHLDHRAGGRAGTGRRGGRARTGRPAGVLGRADAAGGRVPADTACLAAGPGLARPAAGAQAATPPAMTATAVSETIRILSRMPLPSH